MSSDRRAASCAEPRCTTTMPHHTHTDAVGRSWCCGEYPFTDECQAVTADAQEAIDFGGAA